jgi:hypothetical protein
VHHIAPFCTRAENKKGAHKARPPTTSRSWTHSRKRSTARPDAAPKKYPPARRHSHSKAKPWRLSRPAALRAASRSSPGSRGRGSRCRDGRPGCRGQRQPAGGRRTRATLVDGRRDHQGAASRPPTRANPDRLVKNKRAGTRPARRRPNSNTNAFKNVTVYCSAGVPTGGTGGDGDIAATADVTRVCAFVLEPVSKPAPGPLESVDCGLQKRF